MSEREAPSPRPWTFEWHTRPSQGGDFTIYDADGRAVLFEGNCGRPGDPELICEAVNNWEWAKEQLALLGIPIPHSAQGSRDE